MENRLEYIDAVKGVGGEVETKLFDGGYYHNWKWIIDN